MQTYLVGGAVRDQLLGLEVFDRDWVVVGATPEQMRQQGFQPVGKDFPVFLHPQTHEEYALARTERKSGRGYQGFEFFASPRVTLEQDLARRDLTINAMAQHPNGDLVDPYGGRTDLDNRTLRHVSSAFSEDPLRILRVARFAARFHHLGFQIATSTQALMTQLATSGELADLSAERVWKELERALTERSPQVFFSVLASCNGLDLWLPEFKSLFSGEIKQPAPAALTAACTRSDSSATRLAVISALLPHSAADLEVLFERLKAPKAFRDEALLLARFNHSLAQLDTLTAEQRLQLYEGLDLGRRPERLQPFMDGCQALYPNANPTQLTQLCQQVESIQPQALVSEGFKGKALGEELRRRRIMTLEQTLPGVEGQPPTQEGKS